MDIEADSVLPATARIRAVGDNVAATVVLACQKVNRKRWEKIWTDGSLDCVVAGGMRLDWKYHEFRIEL